MVTDREKRMAVIFQRLAEWNSLPLGGTPRSVLKNIVKDSENLLEELGFPRFPIQLFTAPASGSSEETSEPSKNLPPEDR